MSLKNILSKKMVLPSVIFVGLALGYGSSKIINHLRDPWSASQTIARQTYAKRLVASDPKLALTLGKHLALMNIELHAQGEIPKNPETEVKIMAEIKLLQPINSDLNYQWILPEGVHVVQGDLDDSLANVPVGQIISTEITVVGFSKEKMQNIVLEATVDEMGTRLGTTQLLNSRPEDTQEALAPLRQQAVDESRGNN